MHACRLVSLQAVKETVLGLLINLGKLLSPAEIECASTQLLLVTHAHAHGG